MSSRGYRTLVSVLVGALSASSLVFATQQEAAAAGISDPPTLPHSIISFPVRDFVSATGYARDDRPTVEVVRGGIVVGTASGLVPQDDPKTAGFDGLVEVNHPGGGCWEGVTPDIRGSDVIRVLTSPDTGDSTPTADVTITQPATKTSGSTVVVKGTAVSSTGGQIPVDQLEARIVANQQSFALNGRRTLRADSTGGSDGTLAYDGPGSTTWTATFTGLSGVNPTDGLSDADRAVANQTRGMWLGRVPGAGSEGTIYEYGEVGGPSAPCTAPLASGPSTPDMTAATDSGSSSSDNITMNRRPDFRGVVGLPSATSVRLYVDGVLNGTSPVGAGGSFTLTPDTPLADGDHRVTASEIAPGGTETTSSGSLTITVDNAAPAAPTVTGTVPVSPGGSTAPSVKGTSAEAGTTVTVYTDAACAGPGAGSSTATAFGSTGITANVASGSNTSFFATATDVAGNVSSCSSSSTSYTQDGVAPPAPTIADSSTSGLVSSTTASFSFSDSEAGVSFQCSQDGDTFAACASPKGYTAVGQGAHTFAVRAVDSAGNIGDAASTSWTVDTVAPTVSISSPVGAVINDPGPTFRFLASEPGSSVVCSLDGAAASPCTTSGTQTSSGLGDGPHTFTVRATDPAGNTGPAASYSFAVDTRVPTVSIDSAPPSPTNDNRPSFAFSSPKAGVTFTCSFALASASAPTFAPCADGSFVSGARSDGAYRFTVRGTDAAGNVGSASTDLTIDTVAPVAPSITSQPDAVSSVTTPTFGFSSADTGASFVCSLSPGGSASPCSTGETYGPLSDGSYVFRVQARDQAGNLGLARSVSFKVDTVSPGAGIDSGPIGLVGTRDASFAFSSADTTATFECALAPSKPTFTACSSATSYTALADGTYTFQVRARDAAGNVGAPVSRTFTVDATGPVVTVQTAPSALTRDTSPVFAFSTSETASSSCSLVPNTAADSFSACTSPVAYSGLADGRYRFAVKAADPAGNTSAMVTKVFVVDTTAPTRAITAKPAAFTGNTTPTIAFKTSAGAAAHCSLQPFGAPADFAPCTSPSTLGPLADGTYTFSLTATDAAGNTSAPLSTTFTVDTGAPTVSTRTPAPGTKAVSQTANVTVGFSEPVTGVSATSLTLATADGTAVPAAVTYSAGSRTATLNPTATLAADTVYTATLGSTVKDRAGNTLAPLTWTFVTGPRPTAVVKPGPNTTGILVTTKVTATFSEPVNGVTSTSFTLKDTAGNTVTAPVAYDPVTRVATLIPSSSLKAGTTYTASLTTGVEDLAGNPFAGRSWSFTTRP